jgi:His-Xaa-Ser repeat protein HxsA
MRKTLTLAGGALSALHGAFQDTEGTAAKQSALMALAQEDANYTTTLVAPLNAGINNLYAGHRSHSSHSSHRSHSSHYSGSGGSYRAPASAYTPPPASYSAPAPSTYSAPAAPRKANAPRKYTTPRRVASPRTYAMPNVDDYALPSIGPVDTAVPRQAGTATATPASGLSNTPQSSWRRWAERSDTSTEPENGPANRASADQLRLMIMRVQAALYSKGYDPGAIDGVMRESTIHALREFQEAYGLTPSGKMTTETLNALGVALVR